MIKRLLFGLSLFLLGAVAHAAPDSYWDMNGGGTKYYYGTAPRPICDAYIASLGAGYAFKSMPMDTGDTHAVCRYSFNGSGDYVGGNLYLKTCAASTPYYVGGAMSLNPPTICSATAPPPPPPTCVKGEKSKVRTTEPAPLPSAYQGCKVTITEIVECYSVPPNMTQKYCEYIVEKTGDAAATGSTNASAAPATPPIVTREPSPPMPGQPGGGCPKGSVQGGMGADGVPQCIGTGTAPQNPPAAPAKSTSSVTATNADGSTTVTTTTTQTNVDGSTTTTVDKVTTAADGTTNAEQTRETGATPSGAAGAMTPPPSQEQANFCKQNPHLAVCRESSVTGSCGQTACVGDAIQCATLRAAAAMECKLRTDEDALKGSALHALGVGASSGADPMGGSLPTVGNASVVNMPTMAASGWIGAGAAFRDVSFTLQGKSFTLPLEKWTGYLVGLRYALMIVAMLVSFRMLSGVILRD